MVMEKNKYTVTKITDEITWIYDGDNSSIYVDEAEDAAFVIDTGMAPTSLVEAIRTVTDKPLTLVITHGHLDHSMKAAEFDKFYMSELDNHLIPEEAGVDLSKEINIVSGDVITIPGLDLVVVDAHGHTPGSVLFVDRKHKAIFSGDAFCNGRNVWLQLPGCSHLADYRDTIRKAIATVKAMGADDSWLFLGGHLDQRWQFRPEPIEDNLPCFGMWEDLAVLCDKLLSGEIVGETELEDMMAIDQPYHAHYGRAEILYTLDQIRDPGMTYPEAVITMESGAEIVIELRPDVAPQCVRSFIYMAEQGVYDGHAIERIRQGTLIDVSYHAFRRPEAMHFIPNDTNSGKYLFVGPRTIAMGGYGDNDIAAAEFYFALQPEKRYTGRYPVFGEIKKGYEELVRIAGVELKGSGNEAWPGEEIMEPVMPEVIRSVRVNTFGVEYPKPDFPEFEMPDNWK